MRQPVLVMRYQMLFRMMHQMRTMTCQLLYAMDCQILSSEMYLMSSANYMSTVTPDRYICIDPRGT